MRQPGEVHKVHTLHTVFLRMNFVKIGFRSSVFGFCLDGSAASTLIRFGKAILSIVRRAAIQDNIHDAGSGRGYEPTHGHRFRKRGLTS